ncbi:MAG: multifunctional CCA tRNA nucleotidyl transferase/2'3'-cyclic phosphodiesterase/2'nucleotidase/phosphatase [Pseudomonadaceae bacterium]|nr:multifunctional CCA tRNA nucleotidyl transferase/2'3'-cyclic phosphodiesterase/2'nucleotidase/phosphatase [Pseudomonadaceae bacterium]
MGGAVRDELLGRAVKERDWVVVGETAEAMLRAGFTQVGRDFPVFLHPQSKEEYALARTERKTGPGHTGFTVHADPSVTLEEDLIRRDLTINALAQAEDGALIDPFGGQRDLQARLLRHVSEAFSEDPLRIFRLARFASQLNGFEVAPETADLVRSMAAAGATLELPAERVWQEFRKSLGGVQSQRFWQVLEELNALEPWFAELAGLQAPPSDIAADDRFVALGIQLSPEQAVQLAARLKVPNDERALIEQVARHGRKIVELIHVSDAPSAVALASLLQNLGALRQGDRFTRLSAVLASLFPNGAARLAQLSDLVVELRGIGAASVVSAEAQQPPTGKALGEAITAARLAQVERWLKAPQ